MDLLHALILGIVQGITEFFPISSSAHLHLARAIFSISENSESHYFDLTCHSGTLLALLFFLRKEIWTLIFDLQAYKRFTLALLPLVPAYFLLKPLRDAASDPAYLGYALIGTALLLFFAVAKKENFAQVCANANISTPIECSIKYQDVLCIGIMQTLALIPGISRSGSTIAAARLLGWDWLSSARFSFLLAIPAILGGQALETYRLFSHGPKDPLLLPLSHYLVGFAASFLFGLIGVRFVFHIYKLQIVSPFAWYCLLLGLSLAWRHHG